MEINPVVFAGEYVGMKNGCASYNTSKPVMNKIIKAIGKTNNSFLVAPKQLFKSACSSVCRSVRPYAMLSLFGLLGATYVFSFLFSFTTIKLVLQNQVMKKSLFSLKILVHFHPDFISFWKKTFIASLKIFFLGRVFSKKPLKKPVPSRPGSRPAGRDGTRDRTIPAYGPIKKNAACR